MKMLGSWGGMAMLVVSTVFVACSKDDEVGPKVPDPEGTEERYLCEGTYWYFCGQDAISFHDCSSFYIFSDSFDGNKAEFISLGKMKGLGNITEVPETGWQSSVAVRAGWGYVAKFDGSYCRFYVVKHETDFDNRGIICSRVLLKFQHPFKATTLELSSTTLHFTQEGGTQTVEISTDADSWDSSNSGPFWGGSAPVSWLKYSQTGNRLEISIEKNESFHDRYTWMLIRANEKREYIIITQDNKPTQAPYKIGDFYNENGVAGVVYKVTDNGMHGMITSLETTLEAWAVLNTQTNALDRDNGMNNMHVIKQQADWESRYPVFKWCDDLNRNGVSGWYLPSINELKELYAGYCGLAGYPGYETDASIRYEEARSDFEAALSKVGGKAILPPEIHRPLIYMSSTETEMNFSYFNGIRFYDGLVTVGNKTGDVDAYYVARAVRPF